jgi:hypothetical protein
VLAQHLRGDQVVGPPPVADLAGAVLGIPAASPVDLVGLNAGGVVTREEGVEALAQDPYASVRDEALLDDQEAVVVEAVDLLVRQERGRLFSVS